MHQDYGVEIPEGLARWIDALIRVDKEIAANELTRKFGHLNSIPSTQHREA